MDDFKVPQLRVASLTKQSNESPAVNAQKETEAKPSVSSIASGAQVCPYKVPPWSQPPYSHLEYRFEVLKSGQIIEDVKNLEKKAFWKFGRLPTPANDIELAHPTISRFHAVLQYRTQQDETPAEEGDNEPAMSEGWYIYDLGSTHGTYLNKQRVPAHVFIRVHVGHMLRLGGSTRSYILQGPAEDEEPESELSVTELREQRQQMLANAAAEAKRRAEEAEERERNEGASWGMTEDADEETDLTHNPYASTNNEELFLDDPKRTLRGYFEREGLQLEYKCDEMSAGSFVCRVELPLDDAFGRPIVAEVVHKGRKKECVVQCALEACRILDRHGVLRQANQEPLKRKVKSQSDSDEDDFLDRTGDIERKKQRKTNAGTTVTLTYEDLLKQEIELSEQLKQVEDDILKYQETQKRLKAARDAESNDDLDSFMETLKDDSTQLDKTEIRKLRLDQQRIKAEQQKVQRLLKITKPLDLPYSKPIELLQTTLKAEGVKKQMPMIGKRNQFSKFKVMKTSTATTKAECTTKALASDEEEVEEDENVTLQTQSDKLKQQTVPTKSTKEYLLHSEEDDEQNITSKECKLYGPAAMPTDNLECMDATSGVVEDITSNSNNEALPTSISDVQTENLKRKRRRQRQRHKRQDIDVDELEEHESSEKYAKWVPPANQSGDGYTKLNEKYGY